MVLETATGDIAWQEKFPWETRTSIANSIKVIANIEFASTQEGNFLIVEAIDRTRMEGRRWSTTSDFLVIGSAGDVIQDYRFSFLEKTFYRPKFVVDSQNQQLMFGFGTKIMKLDLR